VAQPSARADDAAAQALFDDGNREYALGNHTQAVQRYETLIAQHGVSAPVLFNLGTAQLQAGKPGAASASLLAAARLAPGDQSIARNLAQARFRARDTVPSSPAVTRALGFLTPNTWTILACVSWWLACSLCGVMVLRPAMRPRLRGAALASVTATALLSTAAIIAVRDRAGPPLAFISAAATSVHRAPLRESERAFELNDGAAVRVLDALGDWRLVRLGDGREGWVASASLAVPLVR
jgi:tetratricopeptide (TPR) repeat protein